MELLPWAMFAKGPACTSTGVPSSVWNKGVRRRGSGRLQRGFAGGADVRKGTRMHQHEGALQRLEQRGPTEGIYRSSLDA
eukprot:1013110-Prorocentrum_minimum.AAC.1